MLLSREAAEHFRKRTGPSRMPRAYAAIARHHHPSLPVERANVGLIHRSADYTSPAIAHDLLVSFDLGDVFRLRDFGKRLEFEVRMRFAIGDENVARSSDIAQRSLDLSFVFVLSTRHEDSNRRSPRRVGI